MTPTFRTHRRNALTLGSLTLALLASGCATTTPDSKLPAVYCVNAPGASSAPSSVPAAYCTNLQSATSTPAPATAASPTASSADHEQSSIAAPAATSGAASTTTAPPETSSYRAPTGALALAPDINLDRYMGRWYVIANIPYAFENGDVGAYVDYKKDGDNIQVVYHAHRPDFDHPLRERKGGAYVVKNTHRAEWRVTYLWPVYTSYEILYVDPDYQYALVGYPGRSLGWVYSRSPHVDDAKLQSLLARFAADGYDISQFRRVPQTPEQVKQ